MKIEIKCRFSGSVLFSHEAEGNTVKLTVEAAVKAGANLAGANLARANLARANLAGAYLTRANLDGAYLDGANLARANLDGANLAGANLDGANLAGAYLTRANLDGAYLDGANLDGANLDGANLAGDKKLVGNRPIFQIGPIGSRSAYLVAYITDSGICIKAGCFFGTASEFAEKVSEEHGDNNHANEYEAALKLIEKHAAIWTPAEAQEQQAESEAAQ